MAGLDELQHLIDALPRESLERVFTHPAWAEERAESYERLEFLGDSVLELAVARELYARFPDLSEGRLAKIRSHVVSRRSCAEVAGRLGLGERLVAGGGAMPVDELARLGTNRNVLAAVLEAAFAAVFLQVGFERIAAAIVDVLGPTIDYAANHYVDYKTELQEAVARLRRSVAYTVIHADGPAHERVFTCAVLVDGEQAGQGTGRTKKDAEQAAAREALLALVDQL